MYVGFIAGFALEALCLLLCFLSLNLKISFLNAFSLFAVLYFLSRVPFLPQGVILVEVVGFVVISGLDFTRQEAGAVLVVWDAVRLFTPIVLSIGCLPTFLRHRAALKGGVPQ